MAPNSVDEVGCIHTCQGLEVDYIGVIIGPDRVARGGKLITQADERTKLACLRRASRARFRRG